MRNILSHSIDIEATPQHEDVHEAQTPSSAIAQASSESTEKWFIFFSLLNTSLVIIRYASKVDENCCNSEFCPIE